MDMAWHDYFRQTIFSSQKKQVDTPTSTDIARLGYLSSTTYSKHLLVGASTNINRSTMNQIIAFLQFYIFGRTPKV